MSRGKPITIEEIKNPEIIIGKCLICGEITGNYFYNNVGHKELCCDDWDKDCKDKWRDQPPFFLKIKN